MNWKERTRKELVNKIDELEDIITQKGIGSDKLKKAKRAQRDINIGLMLGVTAVVAGLAAWALLDSDGE
jgi:hypothetical protein